MHMLPNKRHRMTELTGSWVFPVAKGYSIHQQVRKDMTVMQEEHVYNMSSNWIRDKIVTIEVAGGPEFQVATPSDFWPESPKELISPEDLFVASALSCYGVTLVGTAKRYHGEFKDFHLTGTGTLQKGEFGWEFEQITIEATIIVDTEKDRKRMMKAAERAHQYCLVANSMKCQVNLNYDVVLQ